MSARADRRADPGQRDAAGCRSGTSWPAGRPTVRRSSTCPSELNVNENPYGPGDEPRRRRSRRRSPTPRGSLNRYPDRDALALRADLAAYLNADGATA